MKKTTKKINKKVSDEVINKVDKCCSDKSECCCDKSKMIKIQLVAVLIVLAVIAGLYIRFGSVATVNGKSISRIAYISKLQKLDNKTVLDQMIQDALISNEAAKKNVKVEQKEVDDEISKIEEQIKKQGMTLEDAMKSEGVTKEEIFEQIKTQKIVEKLSDAKIEIKQEQIDKFLADNKDYLPKDKSKEEIQALAKLQLEKQEKNAAIDTWLANLKKEAKIIYK